eukprot:8312897-Lingulodinium_polyedra.AAC.1
MPAAPGWVPELARAAVSGAASGAASGRACQCICPSAPACPGCPACPSCPTVHCGDGRGAFQAAEA